MAAAQTASSDETYRRISRRLIPFLLVCYIVAMVDRLNIGFAKLQFVADLGLNEAIYGLAASVFYVGYVLFEVPSNLFLQRFGIRWVLPRIMVLWGIVTMALGFAGNQYHLYVLRFLLGVAEAGFFPGVVLYLTFWFPNRLRGQMTSRFTAALPIAGIVAGPISGYVMSEFAGVAGLRGWQWLFLVEGLPAIGLGIASYFLLANGPAEASWLSAAEKEAVARDLSADRGTAAHRPTSSFREALRDPQLYKLALIYFMYFCALNAVLLWIPTLLRSVGVTSVKEIGWLSAGIATFATVGMLVMGYTSDRTGERRLHVAGAGLSTAAAFLLMPLAAGSVVLTTALLAVASFGVFSVLALFWTIPSTYLEGRAAAGGLAFISSVGAFGGAVSPTFIGFMREMTGSFYGGLGAVAVLLAAGMVLLYLSFPVNRPTLSLSTART